MVTKSLLQPCLEYTYKRNLILLLPYVTTKRLENKISQNSLAKWLKDFVIHVKYWIVYNQYTTSTYLNPEYFESIF